MCEVEKSPIKNRPQSKEWLDFVNSHKLELNYNHQK